MARNSVSLVFGGGVERASGVLAGSPEKMRDLRNFHTQLGKIQARGGLEEIARFGGDYAEAADGVLASRALVDQQASVHVAYRGDDRTMEMHLAALSGSTPVYIDDWEQISSEAVLPPRIISAASHGKAFFAHDEELPAFRAQTIYYDSFATPNLVRLEADLGGEYGAEAVKFRGVIRHLSYMVGWGFANGDDDRPEFLRISAPGEPHVFHKNWYFIVGQRGDPIINCAPVGKQLGVFKTAESFLLTGYSKETFGVDALDTKFGIAGSKLAITIDGWGCFFWSLEGPRITTGGPSEDLSLPLDLPGPNPTDLATSGDLEDGVAAYVPGKKEVWFIFGRRVYALSLRVPGKLEWSYHEFPWEIGSAGTLYVGGRSDVAPSGHPEFVSATAVGTTAEVSLENVDSAGDEITEAWLKEDAVWSLKGSIPTAGLDQVFSITELDALTFYEVAFRYRRGVLYTVGYEGDDPDAWPAVSRGSFTTQLGAPTNLAASWARTSAVQEVVTLTWSAASDLLQTEVRRGSTVLATLAAGVEEYEDEMASGELEIGYSVRHVMGETEGAPASIIIYAGPTQDAPVLDTLNNTETPTGYVITWTNADDSLSTSIWDDYPGAPAERVVASPGSGFEIVPLPGAASGETIFVFVRHAEETFGVWDYGPISNQLELLLA